jgi:plastocyanin
MRYGHTPTAILSLITLASLHAADIQGTIVVERRLTKAKITAAANAYTRGIAVELHSDQPTDAFAFERSHVAVYLEGALPSTPRMGTMDQKGRQFLPDLLVLPAGSTVSFPNLDPIFHNVFSLSKPKEFDLGNYPKDHTRTVTFAKPGIVFVNCHLHANMAAIIMITPNQWSTLADTGGKFRLADVPPGTYTVVAWHKAAGFFRQRVTVSEKGTPAVNFFIPLAADRVVASR